MASTDLIHRVHPASTDGSASKWAAGLLILGTIGFNAALCFVNTRGVPVSSLLVMMSEGLLISGAILACSHYLNATHITILALIVLYTLVLSALRYSDSPGQGFDPKICRDLVIPVVFFLLGKAVDDIRVADRLVLSAALVLLAFALFEYFFLDSFLRVFDVAKYYFARGTLDASKAAVELSQGVSEGLMVSGVRPPDQGRTLLPFLGDHRVSSLFLEPSTLGNLGMLVTLWAVVRSRMEGRLYIWCALGGLALLILSDTRFDAYFLLLALPILMLPPRLVTPAVFVLPFVTILALCALGATGPSFHGAPALDGLGIYDRLLYSGRILWSFDIYNWFGLEQSSAQTFDSGYGYIISNIGLVGFALLWGLFMSLRGSNRSFYAFRNVLAVYFATLLCISASVFTIKLAAMLWFLLGVLSLAKDGMRQRAPASDFTTPYASRDDRLWWPSPAKSPVTMRLAKAVW